MLYFSGKGCSEFPKKVLILIGILTRFKRLRYTSLFLLLNKYGLTAENCRQATSIIIEDLNLQKKFHSVHLVHDYILRI